MRKLMRHRDRSPIDEFEHRRGGGWDGGQREEAAPGDEQHRPPGQRDQEGRRGRGGRAGRGGRGRAQRGDVRTAIMLMLAGQPMHGYEVMQAMSDRTGGAWRPSPGAVYPTIAQLEDEGLVTTLEEGGRRLVTLTSEGRAHLEERTARLGDPFTAFAGGANGPDLRDALHELHAAARQITIRGSAGEVEAAERVLRQARRSLYLILAGEAEEVGE